MDNDQLTQQYASAPSAQDRTTGVVVIGRNEGERLKRCLESLREMRARTVYVDSGSSDGSVAFGHSVGVAVLELDLARGRDA